MTKARVAVVVGLLLLLAGLHWLTPVGASLLEAPVPNKAELLAMIADDESVSEDRIALHVVDTTKDLPYVMYSVKGVPEPAPVDQLPVAYRALIHPMNRPWAWMVGGGSRSNEREPGTAVSFGFTTSLDGNHKHVVSTVIYGESAPNAAKLTMSVHGTTYVRDLRENGGYLILLSEQDMTPDDIHEFHVFDDQGNELPVPRNPS